MSNPAGRVLSPGVLPQPNRVGPQWIVAESPQRESEIRFPRKDGIDMVSVRRNRLPVDVERMEIAATSRVLLPDWYYLSIYPGGKEPFLRAPMPRPECDRPQK